MPPPPAAPNIINDESMLWKLLRVIIIAYFLSSLASRLSNSPPSKEGVASPPPTLSTLPNAWLPNTEFRAYFFLSPLSDVMLTTAPPPPNHPQPNEAYVKGIKFYMKSIEEMSNNSTTVATEASFSHSSPDEETSVEIPLDVIDTLSVRTQDDSLLNDSDISQRDISQHTRHGTVRDWDGVETVLVDKLCGLVYGREGLLISPPSPLPRSSHPSSPTIDSCIHTLSPLSLSYNLPATITSSPSPSIFVHVIAVRSSDLSFQSIDVIH